MDINRGNMDALFTGWNKTFKDAFALGGIDYQAFCTEVPSGTSIENFPFIEQLSGMKEWLGPRQIKSIASKKLTVRNRKFEDTVGMPEDDIADDQFGMYTPVISQMGQNAANLWPELAFEAICGSGAWLDGAAFFGTARKYGDATIANEGTGALTPTTYGAARVAMMSYQGHGGKALNVIPNRLLVGPALEAMANRIILNDFWYDSTDKVQVNNPYKGTAAVQVSTQLVGTYANYWFLMDTRGVVKPVVISKRENPRLTRKDREEDDNVFFEGKVVYGTKARGEAACAYPHLIYRGRV